MSHSVTVLSPSDKLQQAADLLNQVSQLLRELSQPQIIPRDQEYFWTQDWQAKEQEVDQALQQGRFADFERVEDALSYLHQAL